MEIAWFDDAWSRDPAKVGGKGASLGRLANDYSVPPAFNLTVDAFARWGATPRGVSANEPPPDMLETVVRAYTQLGALRATDNPAVPRRSSAVHDAGPADTVAGPHDPVLNG